MRRLLRGQPGLWVSLAGLLVVVAVTVAFIAVASRPPSPTAAARRQSPPPAVVVVLPSPPPPVSPEAVCADVVRWPLDQQLDQLLLLSATFGDLPASLSPARAGVGGFVIFGQPLAGTEARIQGGLAELRTAAAAGGQVSPWLSTDEEGGDIQRLAAIAGPLPAPRQMPGLWNPDQVHAELAAHARSLRDLGIDMDLAPVVDVAPPGDKVADEADRAFSGDPGVVSRYGLAYAAGLRDGGVVAVVKHFPGLGHADANTDLAASTDPPLASLDKVDLLPFEAAFAAGVPAVMISHVRVPGLSGSQPASLSAATYLLLRQNLRFSGVAMTDALDAKAISAAGYTQSEAAVAAIEAGADVAMIGATEWLPTLAALRHAVSIGALPVAEVLAADTRILTAKGLNACPA